MYNFCGKQSQYISFTKIIETFWFRDFSNTWDIRTCRFKYFQVSFLVQMFQNQKKK